MLHDILDDDHIQWHPPLIGHYTNFWPLLIWTLLPNLTFYLVVQGFHRTYATGAACQQRTLTPPDTWSCPTLGLACVLMSRPISPELVLSPDFWILNTPRYFSFALHAKIFHFALQDLLSEFWKRSLFKKKKTGILFGGVSIRINAIVQLLLRKKDCTLINYFSIHFGSLEVGGGGLE